jgi:hypothetical protein
VLFVDTLKKQKEAATPMLVADRRLWLTADRKRIVEDGDPRAAFLFAAPGEEISSAQVVKFKIGPKPKDK